MDEIEGAKGVVWVLNLSPKITPTVRDAKPSMQPLQNQKRS
jgi:hypothetical protein